MNKGELIPSIAYCGLICRLCFLSEKCDGCRSNNNECERNLADKGCFQKQCCARKSIDGCWECSDLYNCKEGIYSQDKYSKVKAFALFIQKEGKDFFISRVIANAKKGLSVEKGKDYDNLEIERVHELLRNGC